MEFFSEMKYFFKFPFSTAATEKSKETCLTLSKQLQQLCSDRSLINCCVQTFTSTTPRCDKIICVNCCGSKASVNTVWSLVLLFYTHLIHMSVQNVIMIITATGPAHLPPSCCQADDQGDTSLTLSLASCVACHLSILRECWVLI